MPQKRILLFTGEGKGKSTAAFGMMARALGHGMHASVIQFVKGDDHVGEQQFFSLFDHVRWQQYGLGFLPRDPESPKMEEHRAAARRGLVAAIQAIQDRDITFVLLDEVCFALAKGLIEIEPLLDALAAAPEGKIVALTGRNAPQALIDAADTATEMRMIKHAYQQGIPARKGVED